VNRDKPSEAFVKVWLAFNLETVADASRREIEIAWVGSEGVFWRAAQAEAYEQAAKIAEGEEEGYPGCSCPEFIAQAIRERAKEGK